MSYELTISIAEDSPEGQNIDQVAESEHVSREVAARRLLAHSASVPVDRTRALSAIGAGHEDAELMDEIMELVMSEREKRNAAPPRG